MRQYVRLGLLSLVAATLVSCSSNSSATPEQLDITAEPRTSAIPTVTAGTGIVLPLAAFQLTDAQRRVLDQANAELINRCGRRFGFDRLVPTPRGSNSFNANARRYGVSDLSVARIYGYHPPSDQSADRTAHNGQGAGGLTQVQIWVLNGTTANNGGPPPPAPRGDTAPPGSPPGSVNGVPIPPRGCAGEATKALGVDAISVQDNDLVRQIDLGAFARMETDSRVQAAYAKWSDCMAVLGYWYKTVYEPTDSGNFSTTGPPSQREIDIAVADVNCKIQHNVAGVMYAVDSAYQSALIQQNLERLTQIRNRYEQVVRNAATTLGVPVPVR